MKLVGKTVPGGTSFEKSADRKRVARYTMPVAGRIVKLTAYLDGLGSGNGDQVARGVIYDNAGNLLGQGDEVLVADGQAPAWIDLPFSQFAGGVPVAAATLDLGLIAGANQFTIRVFGDNGGTGQSNADTYADGASATFGASSPLTVDMSIFATYVTDWISPDRPEEGLARLPWEETQDIFGATGVLSGTAQNAVCGWYGEALDEAGAFALVQRDGPFADWAGKRIAITAEGRTAFVYCKRTAILNTGEDFAVPRRVYAALSLLAQVPTGVEVVQVV